MRLQRRNSHPTVAEPLSNTVELIEGIGIVKVLDRVV